MNRMLKSGMLAFRDFNHAWGAPATAQQRYEAQACGSLMLESDGQIGKP